jgi:FkbM family methyltransferase
MNQSIVQLIRRKISKFKVSYEVKCGIDVFNDINLRCPSYNPKVIFDVGANSGQSVLHCIKNYSKLNVHCFEPVKSNYEMLVRATKGIRGIHCHQIALSDKCGESEMIIGKTATTSSFLKNNDSIVESLRQIKTEMVCVNTIENFMVENAIERVGYLKIDTEGNDLNVLKGAQRCLKNNLFDFVQVEASMNPGNQFHVPFLEINSYITENDYFMFGFYEQVSEGQHIETGKDLRLRRCNIVYVSKKFNSSACAI